MRRRKTVSLLRTSGDTTDPARLSEANFSGGRAARAGEKRPALMILIDPKPLTRQSILEMLAHALPDFMAVAVSTCDELIEMEGNPLSCPLLVVIHLRSARLTDAWVQNTLAFVRLHLTGAPVVLLSDRDDVDDIANALTCDVRGYIPTSVEAEVFFAALRLVYAGGTFVPAHALLSASATPDTRVKDERLPLSADLNLTSQEILVLDLLRTGKSNKLIAAELKIEEGTVRVHVRNIMKKLHAANRTHAATMADHLFGEPGHTIVSLH